MRRRTVVTSIAFEFRCKKVPPRWLTIIIRDRSPACLEGPRQTGNDEDARNTAWLQHFVVSGPTGWGLCSRRSSVRSRSAPFARNAASVGSARSPRVCSSYPPKAPAPFKSRTSRSFGSTRRRACGRSATGFRSNPPVLSESCWAFLSGARGQAHPPAVGEGELGTVLDRGEPVGDRGLDDPVDERAQRRRPFALRPRSRRGRPALVTRLAGRDAEGGRIDRHEDVEGGPGAAPPPEGDGCPGWSWHAR